MTIKYIINYITAPNKELAVKIARACVKSKLVACANIIDKAVSIYEWEGRICEDGECIIIMKSIKRNMVQIVKKVKSLHSYECPCILALPIEDGNKEFLSWISDNCEG